MVHFLFRHHSNSVKLLLPVINVSGHGRPGRRWFTFGEHFHVQHLHLLKLPKNILIYLLLGVPGAL